MATQPHITEDIDLARLQAIYERLSLENLPVTEFVRAIESIDWDTKSAEAFDEAIHMAIGLDTTRLAERLARRGYELHPESDALRRAVIVLGPPRVLKRDLPPVPGLRYSMAWLREHGHEYSGQWVALKDGTLIGNAPTRDNLLNLIGPITREDNVLVTRID